MFFPTISTVRHSAPYTHEHIAHLAKSLDADVSEYTHPETQNLAHCSPSGLKRSDMYLHNFTRAYRSYRAIVHSILDTPQLATSHILRQRVIDQTLALVHHIYTESGLESICTTYIDPTKPDRIQERRVPIRQIAQNPQQFGQHLQIASSDELRIALQKIIGSIDAIDIVEISAREFNALPIEEQQKIAAVEIFD